MDIAELIAGLSRPGAYPLPVEQVEVRHTHISAVFLAGPFVWKIKKPVRLGFLDFGDLDRRRHFCEEEVRLNRRLAPDVYLGVVPVARTPAGPAFETAGPVVEWAVKMRRLPDEATLAARLEVGRVRPADLERLAERLARFHAQASAGPGTGELASFEAVARNARDNFEETLSHLGDAVHGDVHRRLRSLTEKALEELRPLIEERAHRGVPRETHGDLRLDHVYLFPERAPPEDLVVIDCIEFAERFRHADPVADIAFLVMELRWAGHPDLAAAFAEAYFRAAGDAEGARLLAFYVGYRALVRAKVEGVEAEEEEIPEEERRAALMRARSHWLLALGTLAPPADRPALVLVGGLPGTGKSTLSRTLAAEGNFELVRSDVVRKELAAEASGVGDLYTGAWHDRTYEECLRRAEEHLFEGRRVLIDAQFGVERYRRQFLDAARRWAVPGLFLECRAGPETCRRRLEGRRDDVSDADWQVHRFLRSQWEEAGADTARRRFVLNAEVSPAEVAAAARLALRQHGLAR